jgi:hypothetical protein
MDKIEKWLVILEVGDKNSFKSTKGYWIKVDTSKLEKHINSSYAAIEKAMIEACKDRYFYREDYLKVVHIEYITEDTEYISI